MAAAKSSFMNNDDEDQEFDNENESFRYLIVKPENGRIMELIRYTVFGDLNSGLRFLESSEEGVISSEEVTENRLVIFVSIIVRKILHFFGKPLEFIGYVVDFILNLLSENGDFLGLIWNFLQAKVVIPQRGTNTFISTIGHLDGRVDLYKAQNLVEQIENGSINIKVELGNRALMDLCIMASKLAYENANVVHNIVVHHWKMHFVDFYDCWNDFQKECSTQVFIFCDKPNDANLIMVSFRGTEPFDADDWSTDFDYSWYEIPKLGKVHMGFLEALGLGNRANTKTFFPNLIQTKNKKHTTLSESEESEAANIPPEMAKKGAYYTVRRRLKSLLREHKNAKFVVTGHSLGGALAILFPTVLVLYEEMEMMERLLGVYTFGQPRIGNMKLGKFMKKHLDNPFPKYFRVVYCNDIVPRLPYDDKTFLYKHFGVCLYYDSCYNEQKLDEEPNPNFFGMRDAIPSHLNAVWELIRSWMMGYIYGAEYKEGWFSLLFRVIGVALPGFVAHAPTDYVNSIRLGRERILQMSSF